MCVCVCVYGIAPLALVEGKDSPTRTEDRCWSGVNLNIDCDSLTARYSHGKKKFLLRNCSIWHFDLLIRTFNEGSFRGLQC